MAPFSREKEPPQNPGRFRVSIKTLLMMAAGSMAVMFVGMGLLAWFAQTADNAFYINWLIGLSTLGVPVAALFGILSYRSVVLPLQRARREIDRMSSGDLTGSIEANGVAELSRLMQSLRVLQINTKLLIGQIKEVTGLVTTGAGEIASGNADLSGRTESQASSLEETASSMEELTGTVKQNAENSRHASQLVTSTTEIALTGGELVGKVITTMGSIKDSSRKIADIMA